MNQNAKTKRPFPYVTVCLIAVVVLVAAVLLFTLLDSIGVVGKLDIAVKSDNYTVNGNELAVYEYQATISNLANQFWYYQYGLMEDTYGYTKIFDDAYQYAYYMLPSYMASGVYKDTAFQYAEQYVVYCEGAKAAGVELDDEDKKELEDYIKSLKDTAENSDMRFQAFVNTYIGSGISEKEIRSAMEKSLLGAKFAELKNEEFSDAATDADLDKFRDENKSSFFKHYYNSYVLVNEKLSQETIKDKDGNDVPNPLYVGNCTTVDEIKEILAKYMVETHFDKLYKDKIHKDKDPITDPNDKDKTKELVLETLLASIFPNVTVEDDKDDDKTEDKTDDEANTEAGTSTAAETEDKKEDKKKYTAHFTSSDKDPYKSAAYQIMTSLKSSYNTEANKISQDAGAAWMDLTDKDTAEKATALQEWLFNTDRVVGDHTIVKTEKASTASGDEGKSTTYTWVVLNKKNVLDEEKTKDAYYVTLTDDKKAEAGTGASTEANTEASTGDVVLKTGKEKAEAFFAALEKDKTVENFDKLALEYKVISEGGTALKENLSQKSLSTVLGDWLYEKDRKEGDIKMLNSGSTYYVVYFVEENEETWKMNARAGHASKKLNEWYEEAKKQYNVKVDNKTAETENHEGHDHD